MNAHGATSRSGQHLVATLLRPHIERPACHNGHIDEDLQRGLEALAAEYGLLAIYVFGSRAHEIAARAAGRPLTAAHPASDVDVGVEPLRGRTLSAQNRVRLMQQIETLLAARRVDLVILPAATAFLAADVVRGELLLATDLDAEAEVQLFYLRRAADLAPLLREQWRETVGGGERPVSPSKVRVATVMRKSSLVDEMSARPCHAPAREPGGVPQRCPRRGRRGLVPAGCFCGEVLWRCCRTLDITFRPMGSVRRPALENVYKPSGDVVAREIGGEIIIVPPVAGSGDMEDEPFTLNDTGKAIWDQLDGQRRLAGVVAALSPELEEAEDGAEERDVLGLVAELVERRMLVAA